MGKKDTAGKRYFSDPERFADLVNGVCFRGDQIIKADDLSEWDSHIGNKTRDVVWKTSFGGGFAVIGEENQESVDHSLPLRIMESDLADYRYQKTKICRRNRKRLKADKEFTAELDLGEKLYCFLKSDRLCPVVTIVLSNADEWDGPKNLTDMLELQDIPAELRSFISDYRINIVELSKLEEKDTELFRTDLRQVLDVIRCYRDGEKLEELVGNNEAYNDLAPDAYDLMSEYVNLEKIGIVNNEKGQKRRRISMKDGIQQIIDKYTKIGEQRGIEQGKQEGIMQGKQEGIMQGKQEGIEQGISIFITDKVDDGVDYDTIRERLITRFTLTPDSADSYMKKYAVKGTENM